MAVYKVIALSVLGRAKRIYESGETVSDDCFPAGHARTLAERGYIREINPEDTMGVVIEQPRPDDTEDAPVQYQVEEPTQDLPQDTQPEETEATGTVETETGSEEKPGIEDVTLVKMKEDLAAANIPFKPNAAKKDLYPLWIQL
jgi:hypothetical protein